MAKVLLINPPLVSNCKFRDGYQGTRPLLPSLSLAHIVSYLKMYGHTVAMFDGQVKEVIPTDVVKH